VLLPGRCRLASLLFQHAHEAVSHLGSAHVLSQLESECHFVPGKSACKSLLQWCSPCGLSNLAVDRLAADRSMPSSIVRNNASALCGSGKGSG